MKKGVKEGQRRPGSNEGEGTGAQGAQERGNKQGAIPRARGRKGKQGREARGGRGSGRS